MSKLYMSPELTIQLIFCAFLAMIPVSIWGVIFYRKNPEDRTLTALTFIAGALSVFPILFYKYLWQFFPWMNAFKYANKFSDTVFQVGQIAVIPMSVVFTFTLVGVIEEWVKHITVRIMDDDKLRSVDDAIIFSIIAALGFAFTENILYFHDIWVSKGINGLVLPFIFRSLFSTFAHVLFSGIFGYFYGVAHFAKPILQAEMRQKRHPVLKKLHDVFKFKTETLFHREKMMEGLTIAVVLHAVFNIILEVNAAFLIVPYLSVGYLILNHLIQKKENHKIYDHLHEGKRNAPATVRRFSWFTKTS